MSVTLYDKAGFKGKSLILTDSNSDLTKVGFDDKAASVKVASGTWILYEDSNYQGKSFIVDKGEYDFVKVLISIGNNVISSVKLVSDQITLFEHDKFKGRSLPLTESAPNLVAIGFNDKTTSVVVNNGTWILYDACFYKGREFRVTPGSYDAEQIRANIGNEVISSVKQLSGEIVLYDDSFEGRAVPLTQSTPDLIDLGFDNKTSSIIVVSGTWTVYEHANYQGKSYQVTRGTYHTDKLQENIGNDVISSVKLESC